MKSAKLITHSPHRPCPSPSPSTSAVKVLHPKSSSRQAKAPIKSKANFDSKASTTDHTHKLDSSHVILKDISYIEPQSSVPADQCIDQNVSGLSMIDLLHESQPKSLEQVNILKLLSEATEVEDTNIKKELEMKNRLIERLMNENASLREEMEAAMAKKTLNTSMLEDQDQKIFELEKHVGQLEIDNASLKNELERKLETDEVKEAQIKSFEEQVEKYIAQSKTNMEGFYAVLNQQVSSFMEISMSQHKEFSGILQKRVEEMKNCNSFTSQVKSASKGRDSMLGNILKPAEVIKERRAAKERSMNHSIPSLTLSGTPLDTPVKDRSLTMKRQCGAQTSRNYLEHCTKIDEKPELGEIKERSVPTKRMSNVVRNLRKMENLENQNPNHTNRLSIKGLEGAKTSRVTGASIGGNSSNKKKV